MFCSEINEKLPFLMKKKLHFLEKGQIFWCDLLIVVGISVKCVKIDILFYIFNKITVRCLKRIIIVIILMFYGVIVLSEGLKIKIFNIYR